MTTLTVFTQTPESQAAITPAQAIARLEDGNRRFVTGSRLERRWNEQVKATSAGQYPFALVLGCIDSRVPVETVFDQGIGDVFTARVAGNVVNADVLGSMEFACKLAGSKAIVVLGHTSCGAVMGAIGNTRLGHVTALVDKIGPAIDAVRAEVDAVRAEVEAVGAEVDQVRAEVDQVRAEVDEADPGFADRVAEANVGLVLASIRSRSPVLAEMEAEGEIALAGAMYDVATGEVRFL